MIRAIRGLKLPNFEEELWAERERRPGLASVIQTVRGLKREKPWAQKERRKLGGGRPCIHDSVSSWLETAELQMRRAGAGLASMIRSVRGLKRPNFRC